MTTITQKCLNGYMQSTSNLHFAQLTKGMKDRPQMLKWYTQQERVEGFESYLKLQSEKKDDIRSTLKTKDGRPFIMAQ